MPTLVRTLLVLLALAAASEAFLAHAFEIGAAPPTRKILQRSPMPAQTSVHLKAARNEWEAFQIVIRDRQGVSGVDVTITDLCPASGPCIPKSSARLYREHFVTVATESSFSVTYHKREAGSYPDPLVPLRDPYASWSRPVAAPFSLKAGEKGVIFVDLYVPAGTSPGEYRGSVTVSASYRTALLVPIRLTVWDFDMPKAKTVATAFGFSESLIRHYHGGAGSTAAAGYQAIVDRYYLALHEHRIDPTNITGKVTFSFDGTGKLLSPDWTEYDKAVGPWLDGSRFPDGVGVTRFNIGRFKPGHGLGGMTEQQYMQAAAAFAEHLQAKGWWSRAYVYALDEPWLSNPASAYKKIKDDAERLLKSSPLWKGKVLVTSPYEKSIAGQVGIWCPVTPMYEGWFYGWKPYAGWSTYTQRLALGEQLWFYVCNANTPPYAGYDIDSAIGYEPRIVKWGTWYERASGFLYWRATYWIDSDPWNKLANYKQFAQAVARNGDGILLFPGDHDGTAGGKGSPEGIAIDGPVVSYRLKQIRDGLEDWEMFRLAASLGAETYTRDQVRRAYRRFGDFFMEQCGSDSFYYCPADQPWTLDEKVLLDAREKVAQKILFLKHPTRYPDPERPFSLLPELPGPPGDGEDTGCTCQAPGRPPFAPRNQTLVVVFLLLAAPALRRMKWMKGPRRSPNG